MNISKQSKIAYFLGMVVLTALLAAYLFLYPLWYVDDQGQCLSLRTQHTAWEEKSVTRGDSNITSLEQVLWQEAKLLRERKTYMATKGRVLHPLFPGSVILQLPVPEEDFHLMMERIAIACLRMSHGERRGKLAISLLNVRGRKCKQRKQTVNSLHNLSLHPQRGFCSGKKRKKNQLRHNAQNVQRKHEG